MASLRKMIATSISSCMFIAITSLIWPNTYGAENISFRDHIDYAIATIHTIIAFAFPLISVYAFITSIISDEIGKFVAIKTEKQQVEFFVSGVLHIIFGLIFFGFAAGVMIPLFLIDRMLKKRKEKEYGWGLILFSFSLPVILFLLQGLNNRL
jgi:hypothetical protein